MHLALLLHGLPQPSTNGGPMTCWALLRHALGEGHRVTVVSLAYPDDAFTGSPVRQDAVRAQGAELVLLPVAPGPPGPAPGIAAEHFPTLALRPSVTKALAAARPDAAFVYHWDTLAAVHGVGSVPKLGVVDDLWHLPNLRRWQQAPKRLSRAYLAWTWATLRSLRPLARSMAALLNGCEASGSFQAETAAWLRRRGVAGCEYYPAPLADPLEGRHARRPSGSPRPRVLLGPSKLDSTSTAAGLRLFAAEILPLLERELGPEGFEVHVVGEGEPPPELARRLPHPGIAMRGRVEPPDEEFLACDVQLVPTPFVLGKRVRIIAGFAFGCCVVAHRAEAANLPELEDGVNCLLGGSGEEVGRALLRALRDTELRRRLGAEARRTYEERFRPGVAAAAIVRRLEAIAFPAAAAAAPSGPAGSRL